MQLPWLVIFLLFWASQQVLSVDFSHNYWFLKYQNTSGDVFVKSKQEKVWNFCDLRCLYLENYVDEDFVVIHFGEPAYRPDFAACYVKDPSAKGGYTLWENKISNAFYEDNCGMDVEDYLANSDQYKVLKI
jgi:hypothetical protein